MPDNRKTREGLYPRNEYNDVTMISSRYTRSPNKMFRTIPVLTGSVTNQVTFMGDPTDEQSRQSPKTNTKTMNFRMLKQRAAISNRKFD